MICTTQWYKRWFACAVKRAAQKEDPSVSREKRKLFSSLHGPIVELGPGTGANLAYISKTMQWIGIEPNGYMHPYIRRAAQSHSIKKYKILTAYAEELPIPSSSVKTVIATYVLCSVRDVKKTLGEIHRILCPGGIFICIEHVAAKDGSALRHVQNIIPPIWSLLADGCRPNQDTVEIIQSIGLFQMKIKRFSTRIPIISPHITIVARKI